MAGGRGALVYSTDKGRTCPGCGEAAVACRCTRKVSETGGPARLTVKLRLEKKGRGGKAVTVLYDCRAGATALDELAASLKKAVGTGGAVKDGTIELQGDCRERVRELLRARGHEVKG